MSPIRVEIVTQERLVFAEDVDMVTAPGAEGELGILPHHAPLLTALTVGELRIKRGGEEIRAFVAVLDADTQRLAWACAGHPGGFTVGPIADLAMFPMGSMTGTRPKPEELGKTPRGEAELPPDYLLVVASRAVGRGVPL